MKLVYSVAEARNHLAALVHEAEAGRPVRISRRGKPAAVLVSDLEYERLARQHSGFWKALQSFRSTVAAGSLVDAATAFDDVRDRAPGRDVDP
jgi:prevent-host-death family protein